LMIAEQERRMKEQQQQAQRQQQQFKAHEVRFILKKLRPFFFS